MNETQKKLLAFRETCVSKINNICNGYASPLSALERSSEISDVVSSVLEIDRHALSETDISYLVIALQEIVKYRAEILESMKDESMNENEMLKHESDLNVCESRVAIIAWQIVFYEPTIQQFNDYINQPES